MNLRSSSFKVPVAIDSNGNLVSPEHAEKAGNYRCLVCNEALKVRSGAKVSPHFWHGNSGQCSYESVIHKAAKLRVLECVKHLVESGQPLPSLLADCSMCREKIEVSVPQGISSGWEEFKLSTGHVADVACLDDDKPVLAIELRYKHRVDSFKANTLPCPFVELSAEQVIRREGQWDILQFVGIELSCLNCEREAFDREQRRKVKRLEGRELCRSLGLPLELPYEAYAIQCWKCQHIIPRILWPEHGERTTEQPPEPKPPNLRFVRPKPGKHGYWKGADHYYWATLCPLCNALQCDHDLYWSDAYAMMDLFD